MSVHHHEKREGLQLGEGELAHFEILLLYLSSIITCDPLNIPRIILCALCHALILLLHSISPTGARLV